MVKTHKLTRVVPPVWLLVSMVLMYLLEILFPFWLWMPEGAMSFGQLLILLGFTLIFYSARLFKQAETPLKPFVPVKAMVTKGPFRYSRNPVYLGMFMMLAGWAIYLRATVAWLVVIGFIWAIRRFWVLPEEEMMENTMGDAYLKYKSEVRRWL